MVIGWRYTPYGCIAPAPPGGCTRGVSAERFETPLVGGAARFWRLGGNPPTPAFPREGETGKGAIQIPCCRRLITSAADPESVVRCPPRKSLQPLESRNSLI